MARHGRAQWARWVSQWKRSGKTAQEFADLIGVREQTLRHWQWLLGHEQRAGASKRRAAVRFVEALPTHDASSSSSASSSLEVLLPHGARVRVSSGFDEALLVRVVALLGGA